MRLVPFALLLASTTWADEPPPQPKPVRVLLMSSAASREYQFARAVLTRHADKQKLTPTPLLFAEGNAAKVLDLDSGKTLTAFPDHFENLANEAADKKAFNLASYDVIIAFDPDWTRLAGAQQQLLQRWVEKGGGLIVLAGDLHTPALASPARREALGRVRDLYPVVVDDPRLALLEKDKAGDPQPRRVTVTDSGKLAKCLRLGQGAGDGWDTYHGKMKGDTPERGLYRAFPVAKVKAGAQVWATWDKDTPFVVQQKVGAGQVVYVGSPELWRIRQFRDDWHDALWLALVRQVAN